MTLHSRQRMIGFIRKSFFILFCTTFFWSSVANARTLVDMNDTSLGLPLGNTQTLLRIVYFASTKGEIYPCPTCGTNSMGGLSRRSFLLKQLRASQVPLLVLCGADEFLSDLDIMRLKENTKVDPKEEASWAKRMIGGHDFLNIDAGWLSAEETNWLKTYGGSLPNGFTTVEKKPVSRIISTSAGKVGVVFFPQGEEANGHPSLKQKEDVLAAGKKLQPKVSLVIGISPWGNVPEYRFIPEAENVFSLLFGGGGGLGFPYSKEYSTKKLLWVRSESHGRAINTLDLKEIPAPGQPASWLEDITFSADQVFLFLKLPSDPVVDNVLGQSDEEWQKK